MSGERLDRRVAALGSLSRAQAARAVRDGRVDVDGVAIRDPGLRVDRASAVALDGRILDEGPLLAVFHKPLGVHSVVRDDHGRPCLGTAARDLLDRGLHPVGRLDADTTGLLLFSADGAWTQHLLHPKRAIARVYVATVDPPPGPGLVDRLAAGVATAEGTFTAEVLGIDGARVELAVTEGKHRMVRRMLANAGHPVVALHRIRYGPWSLEDLPEGAWRAVDPSDPGTRRVPIDLTRGQGS